MSPSEHQTHGTECCPKFDPLPRDNITHRWENRLFLVDSIPQLFHFPYPGSVKKVITRLWKTAQEHSVAPEMKDFLLLSCDPSPWKAEFYLYVTKKAEGLATVALTGEYESKVFDGPFFKVPAYIREMEQHLAAKKKTPKKYYFYFTTCPKCAKKYGHNYIVAFAQV